MLGRPHISRIPRHFRDKFQINLPIYFIVRYTMTYMTYGVNSVNVHVAQDYIWPLYRPIWNIKRLRAGHLHYASYSYLPTYPSLLWPNELFRISHYARSESELHCLHMTGTNVVRGRQIVDKDRNTCTVQCTANFYQNQWFVFYYIIREYKA